MFPNRAALPPVRPPAAMSTDKNLERRITDFTDKWQYECRQLSNDHPRLRQLAQEGKELLATLSRKGGQEKQPAPHALSELLATVTGLLGRFPGSRQTREDLQQGMQNFLRMLMQHQVLVSGLSGASAAGRDGEDRKKVGLYAERFMRAVVAAHSADRVSESRELCTTLLASVQDSFSHFRAANIAAILWGLGKLAERGVQPAGLETVVTCLMNEIPEQVAYFKAQYISNSLWGLAKLVRNQVRPDRLEEGLNELLQQISRQAGDFNAQGIANSLWALAKLAENQVQPDRLEEGVNELLQRISRQAGDFNAQGIANSLWGLARLVANQVQPDRLEEGLDELLQRIPGQAGDFNAQAIANSLWALAKLAENQVQPAGLETVVTKLVNEIPEQAGYFKAQDISNSLWAMAKLVENQVQPAGLGKGLSGLLEKISGRAKDFEPQGISNSLWALAKLVENQVQPAGLGEGLSGLLKKISGGGEDFNAQGISNSLWALAKLVENQVQPEGLEGGLNELLKSISGQARDFKTQELSNSLWALAKLAEKQVWPDRLEEGLNALLKRITGRARDFKAQEISNSLWALGKLVENKVRPDGLEAGLNELLKRIPGRAQYFKAQEISNSLWALGKLVENQIRPDRLEEGLNVLLKRITGRARDFNAQEISTSLWALASMGVITQECPALFEDFFASLEGNDLDESHKRKLAWALTVAIARQLDTGSLDKEGEQLAGTLSRLVRRICVDASSSDGQLAGRIRNQAGLVLQFLQDTAGLDLGSDVSLDASGYAEGRPSETQHRLAGLLRSQVSLKVQEEQGLSVHNAQLPPVDMTVEHKAQDGTKRVYYLEVQGPTHYVKWGGKSIPNGSTLLKRQLYMAALRERNGQGNNGIAEYLEIPVGMCDEFLRETGACEEGQAVAWQKLFERARAGGLYPPSSVEIAGRKNRKFPVSTSEAVAGRKPPVSTSAAEADRKPPALALVAETGRKSPSRSWARVAAMK